MECGRTVSPFPHAHSISGLNLMMGRRMTTSLIPFSPLCILTICLFILMRGWWSDDFPCTSFFFECGLMQPGEETASDVTHVLIEWYLTCFPSEFQRSGVKFPHVQVESLHLLPQCGLCKSFLIASLSRTECCFSHIVNCVY